jgi:hypothetical protein
VIEVIRPRRILTVAVCLGVMGSLDACGSAGHEETSAKSPQGHIHQPSDPESSTASDEAQEDANASMRAETQDRSAAVLPRVQAYSDAFLGGHPTKAYALLSQRCRGEMSLSHFTDIVKAAEQRYGKALRIKTSDVAVHGEAATVSYTYDVPALNQRDETWVREHGSWHNDDC